MIKNRPLVKMHKAERPPERCMICLSDNEQWYIDTGLDTTFDGTFYVGKCCVNKIVAQSPDHFNREEVTRLLHENRVKREEALTKVTEMEEQVRIMKIKFATAKEFLNE